MSGLDLNTYYGPVSRKARVFNKLDPEQVKEAITLAQRDIEGYSKDISNVHFENDLDSEQVGTALSEFKNNSEATKEDKEEENELDI